LTVAGPNHDGKEAMKRHLEAVRLAETLVDRKQVAVRREAKRVVIDAHLSIAGAVAWGNWKKKEEVVPKWLLRAAELVEEAVKAGDADKSLRLHAAARSLSAYAGVAGKLDGKPLSEKTVNIASDLIHSVDDPVRKRSIEWITAAALLDAVALAHSRGQDADALKYANLALTYASEGGKGRDPKSTETLTGLIYFRIGAVHAVHRGDHATAVSWYEKATPLIQAAAAASLHFDEGRRGEAMISMGVSYWSQGQKQQALRLTESGVRHVRAAVEQGIAASDALAVPYRNLAAMHEDLGDADKSRDYERLAGKITRESTKQ
jgi:tetratricopeptide (TPR) repeat protein